MQKRAQRRTSKERLWFIAEHPLLASGAGAMVAIGIGAELSGASKLAALCYLAALVLLIVVFIRAELFRVSAKKAWIILSVTAVVLTVLWVAIRPAPPLSASELAEEIRKQLPPAVPETTPHLIGRMKFVGIGDMPDKKTMFIIVYATIANAGAPSVVNDISGSVIIQGGQSITVRRSSIRWIIRLLNEGGGKEYHPDNLTELAFDHPIPTGGQIAGAVMFLLPGVSMDSLDRSADFSLHFTDVKGTKYKVSDLDPAEFDENELPSLVGSKVLRRLKPKNQR